MFSGSCSDVMSLPPIGSSGENMRAKDLQEDWVTPLSQQRLSFPFSLDVEVNVGPRVLFHQGKVGVGLSQRGAAHTAPTLPTNSVMCQTPNSKRQISCGMNPIKVSPWAAGACSATRPSRLCALQMSGSGCMVCWICCGCSGGGSCSGSSASTMLWQCGGGVPSLLELSATSPP